MIDLLNKRAPFYCWYVSPGCTVHKAKVEYIVDDIMCKISDDLAMAVVNPAKLYETSEEALVACVNKMAEEFNLLYQGRALALQGVASLERELTRVTEHLANISKVTDHA